MLVGLTVMLLVVIPWFVERMTEVANRPLIRMQQQQEAARLEAERKRMAEVEVIRNVRQLVKEGQETDRQALTTQTVHIGPSHAEIEAAWDRWYQKPEYCRLDNERTLVACANDHVKKRAEFDRLVSAGRMP